MWVWRQLRLPHLSSLGIGAVVRPAFGGRSRCGGRRWGPLPRRIGALARLGAPGRLLAGRQSGWLLGRLHQALGPLRATGWRIRPRPPGCSVHCAGRWLANGWAGVAGSASWCSLVIFGMARCYQAERSRRYRLYVIYSAALFARPDVHGCHGRAAPGFWPAGSGG